MAHRPGPLTPLGEARNYVVSRRPEGVQCPCCDQRVQEYRWSLYSTAINLLIALYKEGGTDHFVETKKVKGKGQGDASRLRYFELAEQESTRRPDGGKSGFWRVTERGKAFLEGKPTIYKYVWVFNGERLRFEGPPVTIEECLGKPFHFDAMMAGAM